MDASYVAHVKLEDEVTTVKDEIKILRALYEMVRHLYTIHPVIDSNKVYLSTRTPTLASLFWACHHNEQTFSKNRLKIANLLARSAIFSHEL